jgi:hypothetical protein
MRQLQRNYTREDQSDSQIFGDGCRVTVVEDPYGERSSSADARPNGVGSANRDLALSEPKQESADDHEDDGDENPHPATLRRLSHLETDGPADFEQPSQDQITPTHVCSFLWQGRP